MSFPQFLKFKEQHRNKLLIFISHASGQNPDGRTAKKVLYNASLKIYVEGKRAFSHGRFIGRKDTMLSGRKKRKFISEKNRF